MRSYECDKKSKDARGLTFPNLQVNAVLHKLEHLLRAASLVEDKPLEVEGEDGGQAGQRDPPVCLNLARRGRGEGRGERGEGGERGGGRED